MFKILYHIITLIWGFSPIIAIIALLIFIFVTVRTIMQTYRVAAISRRGDAVNKHREVVGMAVLWILTLILWSPWWLTLIAIIRSMFE